MRLNGTVQLGILFCLYLNRSGRARASDIAQTLGVSIQFLSQIAVKLTRAKIVTTTRGPGGGYELNPIATVLDVVNALSAKTEQRLSANEFSTEFRALNNLVADCNTAMHTQLNKTFQQVNQALVIKEVSALENATLSV